MPRPKARPPARASAVTWRLVAGLLLLGLVLFGISLGQLPRGFGLWYGGAGLVSLAAYGLDKRAAMRGDWRIAEATLQGIDLVGGIVGGLMAQVVFRHKIAKPEFGAGSALIAALHLLGLAAVILGLVHLPRLG